MISDWILYTESYALSLISNMRLVPKDSQTARSFLRALYYSCLVCNHRESQQLKLFCLYSEMHFFIFYRQQITQIGSAFLGSTQQFREAFDQINWNSDTVQGLQQAVLNGPQVTFCVTNDSVSDWIDIRFEAAQVHLHMTSMHWFWVRVVYSIIL